MLAFRMNVLLRSHSKGIAPCAMTVEISPPALYAGFPRRSLFRMFKNVFRSSACLLVMMLGASLAQAQIRSATIAGTVTDSAGAVIPNAEVVVTEQATNVNTPTKSTAAGEFTVPYLPAGTYTVSVNVTGFQPFVVKDLVIATTQTVRVTASLTLSGVQQTIEVAAAAAQIQTDSSSVGGAVEAHTIE